MSHDTRRHQPELVSREYVQPLELKGKKEEKLDLACELSFFHLDEVVKIKEMRSVVTGKFDERTSLCSFRSDKHTEMTEQQCVFPDDMERQTSLDYSASPSRY